MLISNNGALFKKLKSKQNINKYILHGIDILNEIVIKVNHDFSDSWIEYVVTRHKQKLADYLLSTFKSILYVHNNNHNDVNHDDDIETNINISTGNNNGWLIFFLLK